MLLCMCVVWMCVFMCCVYVVWLCHVPVFRVLCVLVSVVCECVCYMCIVFAVCVLYFVCCAYLCVVFVLRECPELSIYFTGCLVSIH